MRREEKERGKRENKTKERGDKRCVPGMTARHLVLLS
jgi:hypothetical protein